MNCFKLDQLLANVPAEMLYEIFVNLPFQELLNIFTLNREIYNLLNESEYFFEKLSKIYCKLNDIDKCEYARVIEIVKKENNFKNFNRSVMIELVNCRYQWDTQFKYFKKPAGYELTCKTARTFSTPPCGSFYTLKAKNLLNPGKLYKWKIRLDCFDPKIPKENSFKILIGIESLHFFPFDNQQTKDVIACTYESKGVALIIGTGEIIQASCGAKHKRHDLKKKFHNGDIIQIEFDFQNVPSCTPFTSTEYEYSSEDDVQYMGLVRFSVIRDGELEELISWIPFGDARFAPFVPAVSLNIGQTISFV